MIKINRIPLDLPEQRAFNAWLSSSAALTYRRVIEADMDAVQVELSHEAIQSHDDDVAGCLKKHSNLKAALDQFDAVQSEKQHALTTLET